MENELIARYIYAVARHLPQNTRTDVEKELDSLIADMLAERCGDILPTDKDVRVVLTELGTPEELAMKYSGDENQALISGINFIYYKQILRIVLPIVVVCVTAVNIVSLVFNWDPTQNPFPVFGLAVGQEMEGLVMQSQFAAFGLAVGQILAGIVGSLVIPFAIITFIFAVFERQKVKLDEGDMFSRLPEVPKGSEKIKLSDCVAGMVFSIVVVVVLLGFPEVIGLWTADTGWVPIFVPAVLRGLWVFIILWAILEIVKESVKIVEGRYTKRLAIVTIICNVLILASALIVFLNEKIVNPEFVSVLCGMIEEADGRIAAAAIFGNINLIIFGAVLLATVVDSVVIALNARKSDK